VGSSAVYAVWFTGVAYGPESGGGEASWQNYLH
jgi:hypothetical protein